MRRNIWTFLSFTIHCLKHSFELFLAGFSMLNNKYLKFGGGRFGCTGIIWDMNIKQENGHGPLTFSALWHQTQSISLTLVTTPRICIGAAPGVHTQNATGVGTHGLLWGLDMKPPQAHALGWYPGKPSVERVAPATCPCMGLGGRQSVYQSRELRSIFLNSELKYFSQ